MELFMKGKRCIGAVLLVLVLSVVPLVVSAFYYQIGLKEYPWFSDSDAAYDFFLYWKGQLLILLCGLIALYTAVRQMFEKRDAWRGAKGVERKYVIPLILYFALAVLSSVLSEQRDTALWGGYEQWEGIIIIAAYVSVLFFAYLLLDDKTEFCIVEWGFLTGVFVLSALSVCQYFGHDFFRTEAGQAVMNFMTEKKLNFKFNFETGRVYATLYNPNYVGSYVALVLPVVLSLVSREKKPAALIRSGLAVATGIGLIIMLFGSESVTGCIGVLAAFVLFVVFVTADPNRNVKKLLAATGGCVVVLVAAVWLNRPVFEYGINKIVNPTPNEFFVKSMESKAGALYIKTVEDDVLKLTCERSDGQFQYTAEDDGGTHVDLYEDAGKIKIRDERFSKIEIHETEVTEGGERKAAFVIDTPSVWKSYTVVPATKSYNGMALLQRVYRIYNPFGKIDRLRHVESMGFEENQHFGSRRGYIWSRTFPLLKNHVLVGSGPNTFVYEFPNDDYVGMKNVGYDSAIVTKPHNMFMQIWVQTGLLSLLAFLALYAVYFAESMKLYFRKNQYRRSDLVGIGILLGTFGYLVTGLANDSTVAVAPVYWCLLGVGMALNRWNKRSMAEEEPDDAEPLE